MRKLLFAFTVATLAMTACQKEESLENGGNNPGGGTKDSLLTRVVYVAGADSVVNEYGYDASSRLISAKFSSTSGSNQQTQIYRNASGVITRYTLKGDDLSSLGIDSLVTDVSYDAAKSHYAFSKSVVMVSGLSYEDSTAFSYDANGNMIAKVSYAKAGPSPYVPYAKTEYTYTGSNVVSEKYFTYDATATNPWALELTYNATYDAKVNPLNFGPEGLMALTDFTYASAPFGSANNALQFDFVDNADPTNNFSFTTAYTYNSSDKPSGGTAAVTPGSGSYTLRYYYQ